ncbi:MAG TPA: YchJ family protein [Dissulfurispiraceae bacterium]|nr:YchJ family protein [Dissulfurispiraceae bacterium]
MTICHCGSGLDFQACCEPILKKERRAETPEMLMRARYSAYATADVDFLHDSLLPTARHDFDREGTRSWAAGSQWQSLEILGGETGENEGTVEFVATFSQQETELKHHEISRFRKLDGVWYLVDGKTVGAKPFVREEPKVGRNDPCPCSSGKKYKKCCGA